MRLSCLVLWSPQLLLIHLSGLYCEVPGGSRGVRKEDGGPRRIQSTGGGGGGVGRGGSRVKEVDFEDISEELGEHSPRVVSMGDFRRDNGEILASCFGLWPLAGSSTIIYDYIDDGAEMLTEEERRKRKQKMKLRKRKKRRNRTKAKKNKKVIRVKKKTV